MLADHSFSFVACSGDDDHYHIGFCWNYIFFPKSTWNPVTFNFMLRFVEFIDFIQLQKEHATLNAV